MKRSGFISPRVQSDLASSASRPCRVPIAIFPGHVDSLAWTVIKIVMGVRGTVSLFSNAPSITDRSARLRPDNAAETGCRTATSIAIYGMVRVRSRDKSRLRKIRRMRATCAGFVSFSLSLSSSLDYIMSIKSPISHGIGIRE